MANLRSYRICTHVADDGSGEQSHAEIWGRIGKVTSRGGICHRPRQPRLTVWRSNAILIWDRVFLFAVCSSQHNLGVCSGKPQSGLITTEVNVFMDKLICRIHLLLLGIWASRSSKTSSYLKPWNLHDKSTLRLATLTVYLEMVSVSIKNIFPRKSKRGLVSAFFNLL